VPTTAVWVASLSVKTMLEALIASLKVTCTLADEATASTEAPGAVLTTVGALLPAVSNTASTQ
jgi:hypothetical protein